MALLDRIKGILLAPKSEWPKIAAEPDTVQGLYTGWIMILAAIGPLAMLLGMGQLGMAYGVRLAVMSYVNHLVGVAVIALIVDQLAPTFGGRKDFLASLKLVAYSFTAVWIAQITWLLPPLAMIVMLLAAIYAFYTFFLGAPVLARCSNDKAVVFTIVVLLCAIVLLYIVQRVIYGFNMPGTGIGPRFSL